MVQATIDIGTDVSAIRVNNTTRTSCDAIGATQWLALTLKGDRVEVAFEPLIDPDQLYGK